MSRARRPNYDQLFLLPPSLDDWVSAEHPVRFVRDLVDTLDLVALGFREPKAGEEGRPHYPPDLLLKVWLFGWMERTRSTRALEKACLRDTAFLWLTGNQHPDHCTLWRFFRDNRKALRSLFKRVVQVAAASGLVGFALHALDGTKLSAASSSATAWHRERLDKELKQLDRHVDGYMEQVEAAATEEDASYAMPTAMQDAEARKEQIVRALAELDKEQANHMHPNEREARVVKTRTHNTLGYNAQIVVDHDSDLIVAADVSNDATDHRQLVPMVEQVAETLGKPAEQTVADAGYYGGEQFEQAERRHLPVLVPIQQDGTKKGELTKANFHYDAERDGYICPRGEFLPLEARKTATKKTPYPTWLYRCHNRDCPVRGQCTDNKKGRTISRTPYDEVIQRQARKQAHPLMKIALSLRKEIVEHLFAIVKSIDGFRSFTVRGLEKAQAQWALACTAVNLRKLYAFWREGRLALSP